MFDENQYALLSNKKKGDPSDSSDSSASFHDCQEEEDRHISSTAPLLSSRSNNEKDEIFPNFPSDMWGAKIRKTPLIFDIPPANIPPADENPVLLFSQKWNDNVEAFSPLEEAILDESMGSVTRSREMQSTAEDSHVPLRYRYSKLLVNHPLSDDQDEHPQQHTDSNFQSCLSVASSLSDYGEYTDVSARQSYGAALDSKTTPSRRHKPHPTQGRRNSKGSRGSYIVTKSPKKNHKDKKHGCVLNKLSTSNALEDQSTPDMPWTKIIILEELGTASSWFVLLLPYLCFIVALVMDLVLRNSVFTTTFGGEHSCDTNIGTEGIFPLTPSPDIPCTYPFVANNDMFDKEEEEISLFSNSNPIKGYAFASGPIQNIPSMSTFITGDASYSNVPQSVLELVRDGHVFYSTGLFQISHERHEQGQEEWDPVFISVPEQLNFVCDFNDTSSDQQPLWNCQSPTIVDVLMDLPEVHVLSGKDVRLEVLYFFQNETKSDFELYGTKYQWWNQLYTQKHQQTYTMKMEEHNYSTYNMTNHKSANDLISTLSHSSQYTIQYPSFSYIQYEIFIRLFCLIVSLIFFQFWVWSMGIKGIFGAALMNRWQKWQHSPVLWFESPWILLPERRYLFFLLLNLFFIQNPLLTYMLLYLPKDTTTNQNTIKYHICSDIISGIGIQGLMFSWLCIMQGLRYHTAILSRKRANQQKQVLELRKAQRYIAEQPSTYASATTRLFDNHEPTFTDHTSSYYDQYGDTLGGGTFGISHLRLRHDPCGDSWADFLLPKFALYLVGVASVILSALSRFQDIAFIHDATAEINDYNTIYVISSFIQLGVLFLWGFGILWSSFGTGEILRKEPFLSTRPAQLAFRVLMGILFLASLSILLPLLMDLYILICKWTTNQRGEQEHHHDDILVDVLMNILIRATKRVPYITTAVAMGPGKILFLTVCSIVAAFIFLPSSSFYNKDNAINKSESKCNVNDRQEQQQETIGEKQSRDKRLIVNLSRYTHTWRVFPIPILRQTSLRSTLLLPPELRSICSFQIDPHFNLFLNNSTNLSKARGMISFEPYVPLFSVETAYWLFEAAWQAYYSATEYTTDKNSAGKINLDGIGLTLEAHIDHEETDTHAFIATNCVSQVDGEKDSIIVVAFRGSCSYTNMRTDLRTHQVSLPETITGLNNVPAYSLLIGGSNDGDDNDYCEGEENPLVDHDNPAHSPYSPLQNSVTDNHTSVAQIANNVIRNTPMVRQAFPCVHQGFLQAYLEVRQQIVGKVLEILQRQVDKAIERSRKENYQRPPDSNDDASSKAEEQYSPFTLPKIYITGHSLGGALSQLLALDLASNFDIIIEPRGTRSSGSDNTSVCKLSSPFSSLMTNNHKEELFQNFSRKGRIHLQPPIAVYTYGQPRVGNHAFAHLYKQRVPHTFRIVNEQDSITNMPLATPFFCQFYKHSGMDVVLDEGITGNILVGPSIVETLFRFTKVRTSVSAHSMECYRNCLESVFQREELEEFYRGHGKMAICHGKYDERGYNTIPDWVTPQLRTEVV